MQVGAKGKVLMISIVEKNKNIVMVKQHNKREDCEWSTSNSLCEES